MMLWSLMKSIGNQTWPARRVCADGPTSHQHSWSACAVWVLWWSSTSNESATKLIENMQHEITGPSTAVRLPLVLNNHNEKKTRWLNTGLTDSLSLIYFCSVWARHATHWQTNHPLCETHAASAASVSQWHPCGCSLCWGSNLHRQKSYQHAQTTVWPPRNLTEQTRSAIHSLPLPRRPALNQILKRGAMNHRANLSKHKMTSVSLRWASGWLSLNVDLLLIMSSKPECPQSLNHNKQIFADHIHTLRDPLFGWWHC